MGMGCASCHSALDAAKVPHKTTNKIAKGLSSAQPDLCYGCHDKTAFGKKTVHAAVGMGCTECHNPHSSKNVKLLRAARPTV
jgi:predicted CXXCH cytochrome family protein